MTIRELRVKYPHLFYYQEWYLWQTWMDAPLPDNAPIVVPISVAYIGTPPEFVIWDIQPCFPAVVFANLYVRFPDDPIWQHWLWTSDKDEHGQRVYVGSNGKGLEIHRHLAITDRWGIPQWG